MKNPVPRCLLIALLACSAPGSAAGDETLLPAPLPEQIVVSASQIVQRVMDTAASISVIGSRELHDAQAEQNLSESDRLNIAGFSAAALHGDMHQVARNRTLSAMRAGQVRVLVATDVAARGIDVPTISHVFNYDLPKSPEDYVHRIGRTGRAGRNGLAISLVNHAENMNVRNIERFTKQQIPVDIIAGYEPKKTAATSKPISKSGWKPGGARAPARTESRFGKPGAPKREGFSRPDAPRKDGYKGARTGTSARREYGDR